MAKWAKVYVGFTRHPQVGKMKPPDRLGYLSLILHCMEYETDGIVLDTALPACAVSAASAAIMESAGLIERVDGVGWQIPGFLKHQRSHAQLEATRAANRKRLDSLRGRKQGAT